MSPLATCPTSCPRTASISALSNRCNIPLLTATRALFRLAPVAKAFACRASKIPTSGIPIPIFRLPFNGIEKPLFRGVSRFVDDLYSHRPFGDFLGHEQGDHRACHSEDKTEDQQCLHIQVGA